MFQIRPQRSVCVCVRARLWRRNRRLPSFPSPTLTKNIYILRALRQECKRSLSRWSSHPSPMSITFLRRERFPLKEIGNLAVNLQDDSNMSRTLSMELSLATRCHKRPKTNGYLPNLSVLLKYVSLHPYSPASPVPRPTFFLGHAESQQPESMNINQSHLSPYYLSFVRNYISF